MKKLLKFIHTLAAMGMVGALSAHIILLSGLSEPVTIAEYVSTRHAIGAIAKWLLLPSLGLVLVSGLLAMAFGGNFYSAGWAWMKLGLGVVTFEGTLLTVQGPAVRAAEAGARVLDGTLDRSELEAMVRGEWGSLWVILCIALINVVLAVWRPRFTRPARP